MLRNRLKRVLSDHSIWFFAFGYFAAYVPYSALTKALSSGLYNGEAISGMHLLPLSLATSCVGMILFLWLSGLWRYATRVNIAGLSVPRPTRWTLLSGLCTATIIATTTLAYTFKGISIVFAMLLMRGGVLIIAPIVDTISRRHVRWFSWSGLGLALAALFVAFAESAGAAITAAAAVDIALYLASYFVRLRLMSRFSKTEARDPQFRYFAEEQLVAAPASLLFVSAAALFHSGDFGSELAAGFDPSVVGGLAIPIILIGLFSQGTGIFGGLILLDKRENTFCVPVNRSSSIMAGVLASLALTVFLGANPPSAYKLAGAGLIIGAIVVLSVPPLLQKKRKS